MTMVAKGDEDLAESNGEAIEAMNRLVAVQDGSAYRQFAIGHNPVDSLQAEEYLSTATDLILSIPLRVSSER